MLRPPSGVLESARTNCLGISKGKAKGGTARRCKDRQGGEGKERQKPSQPYDGSGFFNFSQFLTPDDVIHKVAESYFKPIVMHRRRNRKDSDSKLRRIYFPGGSKVNKQLIGSTLS
ncbi:hypothetical protein C1H46_023809 [Malus baccata]|uniref:Uncharacterized protein n=1 Tax=Malus baccata TaxID=106549 RepID=A0A540LWM2_MALBA|nr:hypothetical protein C1H46_023809 [Malus baccata]